MEDEPRIVLIRLISQNTILKMVKKAKLEMETLGKILLLTVFLIVFLLMFKGCQDQMNNVGTVGMNEYLCWLSQTMKADLSFLFPSGCQVIDKEEDPVDKQGISILMRKCWWMHGQGEKDVPGGLSLDWAMVVGWTDVARTCYIFTPENDTSLKEFETYMRTHDRTGTEKKIDSETTTWAYIQKKPTKETGICFDKRIANEGDKLQKGKRYFIIFYDDRAPLSATGVRDRIIISRDPNFGIEQTGDFAWLRSTLLGKTWCVSWEERQEKKEAKIEATKSFEVITSKFKECANTKTTKTCICDNSEMRLNDLPEGYKIKLAQKAASKSSLTLYDDKGNVTEEIFDVVITYTTKLGIIRGLVTKEFPIPEDAGGTKDDVFRLRYYVNSRGDKKQMEIVSYSLDSPLIGTSIFCSGKEIPEELKRR